MFPGNYRLGWGGFSSLVRPLGPVGVLVMELLVLVCQQFIFSVLLCSFVPAMNIMMLLIMLPARRRAFVLWCSVLLVDPALCAVQVLLQIWHSNSGVGAGSRKVDVGKQFAPPGTVAAHRIPAARGASSRAGRAIVLARFYLRSHVMLCRAGLLMTEKGNLDPTSS